MARFDIISGLCHGAGHRHGIISDYVRAIEYVDCNGNLQKVDDLELIKAAAGNYGLVRTSKLSNM